MIMEFEECPKCRAKTGSPLLCEPCVKNRDAIESLKKTVKKQQSEIERLKTEKKGLLKFNTERWLKAEDLRAALLALRGNMMHYPMDPQVRKMVESALEKL